MIVEHHAKYEEGYLTDAAKKEIEKKCNILLFDGGCFIEHNGEFDVFVLPAFQGKCAIGKKIKKFLDNLFLRHDKLTVKIRANNLKSLRLARHFGFINPKKRGSKITLEKCK
jgi:hypothetical protein